jgi:aldehyde:ferredoxin oxidoreductase
MILPGGYWGSYLRVNLSDKSIHKEIFDDADLLRKHVGGTGMGAKLIYEGIPDGTPWDGEKNRVCLFSGPLAASLTPGSGMFCAVFKGPMTNLAGNTQANGFFSSFLKLNGFDGLVLDGKADKWLVLVISDGEARLIDGEKYLGMDTFQTQDALCADLGMRQASVFSIGPAGENLVRFSVLAGDKGHVCSKNGLGAVLGAKRMKAVVVERGHEKPRFSDIAKLTELAQKIRVHTAAHNNGVRAKYGTASNVGHIYRSGQLPIKNYTTNLWEPHYEHIKGEYLRETFKHKRKACWACAMHLVWMEITEGPYAGLLAEEPEYEALAAFGPQIGNTDPAAAVMLNDVNDRLGMDCNEMGWVLGWTMECMEKGILTVADLDGIDLQWGNAEAAAEMIRRIARRQGFGNILAEGVMRASKIVGEGAENFAVGTMKGSTPRGHDHRGRWSELFDACVSNTGTIEAVAGAVINMKQYGLEPVKDRFSPMEVSTSNALLNGGVLFYDVVSVCRLAVESYPLLIDAINAATGWDMTIRESIEVGRRAVNRLRVFNLKNGLDVKTEFPLPRFSSAPVNGPVAGKAIGPVFPEMRANYWRHMGWTENEGRPLPETLSSLNLEDLIKDAWPEGFK